jgi:hypothetical protein
MNAGKIRGYILALSFLSLIITLTVRHEPAALALAGLCLFAVVILLYRHLGDLTDLPQGHPKMKTLRAATIFNGLMLLFCGTFAVLLKTGRIQASERAEETFAGAIVAVVILFTGNLSPKLPFNRHTGLRLPWTVADEDTWVIAHRILGYLSVPLTLAYLVGIAAVPDFGVYTLAVVLLWVGVPGGLSFGFYYKKTHGRL